MMGTQWEFFLGTWWEHFGNINIQNNQTQLEINFWTIPKNKLETTLA
jgi:hypothetical protein